MTHKRTFLMIALLVQALWLFTAAPPAHAATFQVAAPCGAPQFATAYNDARTGGDPASNTVLFDNCPANLTINLTGALSNMDQTGKTVIINGNGQVRLLGNGSSRLIQVTAGSLELHGLIIEGFNSGGSSGGAVRVNTGTTAVIANSSIISNTTTASGGAVYVHTNATLTVRNSYFSGNTAGGRGGAILFDAGGGSISNSTFSVNTATGNGGGLDINDGTVTINNVTFANNTGALGNSIRANTNGIINIDNSIVAGPNGCSAGGVPIGVINATNSYATAAGCADFTTSASVVFTGLTPATPTFGTHPPALLLGFTVTYTDNPAINTGSLTCETSDQRGFSRVGQNCDAGAVERFTPTAVTMNHIATAPTLPPVGVMLAIFLLLGAATAVRFARRPA